MQSVRTCTSRSLCCAHGGFGGLHRMKKKAHVRCDSRKLRAEVVPDVKSVPEEEEARHLQSAGPRAACPTRRLCHITARPGCSGWCFVWRDSGGHCWPRPFGRYHSCLRYPRPASAASPRHVAFSAFIPSLLPAAHASTTSSSSSSYEACREARHPYAQKRIRCEDEKGASSTAPSRCSSTATHPPFPPHYSRW